ncbi:MAG: DUF4412 domain-containing protein [Bernardetiaceae bacterium]
MTTKNFFFALVVLILAIPTLNAQILNPKEIAKRKTENRANRKIDDAVEGGLDKLEGMFKNKNKEPQRTEADEATTDDQDMSAQIMARMLGREAKVAERYDFEGEMLIQMTTTEKSGKQTYAQKIRYHFPKTEDGAMGFEVVEAEAKEARGAYMVMDWQNGTMLTVLPEQKMITAIGINTDQIAEQVDEQIEKQETEGATANIKKTGRTKQILGYTCQEYTTEDDDSKGVMWMTEDIAFNPQRAMGAMGGKRKTSVRQHYPQNGMLMEATWTDKKSGDQTFWETQELDLKKTHNLITTDYQVIGMAGKK